MECTERTLNWRASGPSIGCFPFVRTDQPEHFCRNLNFLFNQHYPARSHKLYIAGTKEMVSQQKPFGKSYFIVKMTGPVMVQPASSWLLDSALCLLILSHVFWPSITWILFLQSTTLEPKRFDLRSMSSALLKFWWLLVLHTKGKLTLWLSRSLAPGKVWATKFCALVTASISPLS